MISDKAVADLKWFTQGTLFTTSVRILPLAGYDLILGMQWLEDMGDMWVSWRRKRMRFNYLGKKILLKGIQDTTSHCAAISADQLAAMLNSGGVAQLVQLCSVETQKPQTAIPQIIQQVID